MDDFSQYVPYIVLFFAVLFAFFYWFSGLHITDQWEQKPLKRFGRYIGTLGPGVTWREPFSTRVIGTVSLRDQVVDLHQALAITSDAAVQTHDNVPITYRVFLTYRIIDASKFVLKVEYGHNALWNRTLTIISDVIGNTELDSILHDRQDVYARILKVLQPAVADWGAEIIAVELKDVTIADESILQAISMKARAQKEAEAELTRAKAQTQIAKELATAADVYDEPAWKLKGFETLLELCRSAENNTIMVPTDLVQGIAKVLGK